MVDSMSGRLCIRSKLEHDGDELVELLVSAESHDFSAATVVWHGGENLQELIAALSGFPKTPSDRVQFTFGVRTMGYCHLDFVVENNLGQCCVWVEMEPRIPAYRGEKFPNAMICVWFKPADLDEFCRQLSEFSRGRENEAVLSGHWF